MKCVVTGKETKTLRKSIPLSIEGRELLKEIIEKHNQKIEEKFIKKAMEKNESLTEEFAKLLSPKISEKKALLLLSSNEEDISLTRAEILRERSN